MESLLRDHWSKKLNSDDKSVRGSWRKRSSSKQNLKAQNQVLLSTSSARFVRTSLKILIMDPHLPPAAGVSISVGLHAHEELHFSVYKTKKKDYHLSVKRSWYSFVCNKTRFGGRRRRLEEVPGW